MSYNVQIRDTATAEIRTYRHKQEWDDASEFLWTDGNYGCDCNRALFFAWANGEDDPARDCGDTAYAIRITDDAERELYADAAWDESEDKP